MKMSLMITMVLALGLALLVALSASPGAVQAQAECDRFVLGNGGADASDCSSALHPCQTVQYAIDAANTGDQICVADRVPAAGPTTYVETIDIPKTLILDGAWQADCNAVRECKFEPVHCDPARVVLDAKGAGRVVTIVGRIKPTIDCFTITGGNANKLGGSPEGMHAGGGIYSWQAAPIIINNVITANYGCDLCSGTYGRGGGLYLRDAPGTTRVSHNRIGRNVADNSTWGQGGGLFLQDSDAEVSFNTIEYNRAGLSAGDGGGIAVRNGKPVIADNDLQHNVAGQSVMGLGGGIFVWSSSTAFLERNHLESNQAISGPGDPILDSAGGGIYYVGDPGVVAIIRDNTLVANLASPQSPAGRGGGIYAGHLISPSLISGNTLEGNIAGHNDDGYGGGLYLRASTVTVEANTLLDNVATWAGGHGEGGGLLLESSTALVAGNVITRNYGAYFPGPPSRATGYGGGLVLSSSLAIVQDNWIVNNRATEAWELGSGGGVYVYSGTARFEGNTIAGNRATAGDWGFGGGLYLGETVPTLEANTIVDNVAAAGSHGRGGGVCLAFSPAFTLTNNIVAANHASELASGVGIAGGSAGRLAHNTLVANHGGDGSGVHVDSKSEAGLFSNLIANHVIGVHNADPIASIVSARYTLFEGNTTDCSAGVTCSDPVAGPAGLDAGYHLTGLSGAIDSAPLLEWVTRDIDGDPRPIGARTDVGADEYRPRYCYLPLVMRWGP